MSENLAKLLSIRSIVTIALLGAVVATVFIPSIGDNADKAWAAFGATQVFFFAKDQVTDAVDRARNGGE